MTLTLNVGHSAEMTITYLDQNGNPMLVTPTPDTAPIWSDNPSAPGVDTFTPATGGLSAELTANAVGTDTVSVSVTVGGQTFAASLAVTINAAPQVLTSVEIEAVVS